MCAQIIALRLALGCSVVLSQKQAAGVFDFVFRCDGEIDGNGG